jgi:hypothetical protein
MGLGPSPVLKKSDNVVSGRGTPDVLKCVDFLIEIDNSHIIKLLTSEISSSHRTVSRSRKPTRHIRSNNLPYRSHPLVTHIAVVHA